MPALVLDLSKNEPREDDAESVAHEEAGQALLDALAEKNAMGVYDAIAELVALCGSPDMIEE